MKKTKMLQGSIMKKKSDKRQNYDENKDRYQEQIF